MPTTIITGLQVVFLFYNFPSLGDVAGELNVAARALRPMGLADLKVIEANLEIKIAALPVPQGKVVRTLFYDVVAMIGTNPAIMLVKERLLDTTKYVFKLKSKSEKMIQDLFYLKVYYINLKRFLRLIFCHF